MSKPTSRLTRLRVWLARHIDPVPDPGEAWCVNCPLDGGRTRVVSADGYDAHVQEHLRAGLSRDLLIRRTSRVAADE